MIKHIDEQLSAFIDGELGSSDANLLISKILDNDELRSRWANYHLVGHSIHGESTNNTIDLSDSISAALANEPTVFAPQQPRKRIIPAMFKQVAGMAIAATVAAAAVLMVQPEEQHLFNPAGSGNVASASSTTNQNVIPVARNGVNWSAAQPSVASKLNTYLVNHNAYSTPIRGTLPFAPIVSYSNKHIVSADESVVLEYNPTGSSVRR